MSGRVIILDSFTDDSWSDGIPSPSPFSPEYRRPRNHPADEAETNAAPPAKKQRVSVLERLKNDNEEEVKIEDEAESLSEPSGQESRVGVVRNRVKLSMSEPNEKEIHLSQRQNSVDESNSTSGVKRDESVELPRSVSDEDRKQQAKESAARASPRREEETNDGDKTSNDDSKNDLVSDYVHLKAISKTLPPLDPTVVSRTAGAGTRIGVRSKPS